MRKPSHNVLVRFIINRKRNALFVFLLLSLGMSAAAAAYSRLKDSNSKKIVSGSRSGATEVKRVRRNRMDQVLRTALDTFGNRLEHAGKERIIMFGNLTRNASAGAAIPVRIVAEFPHRVRIEELHNGQSKASGFDGHLMWGHNNTNDEFNSILLESLVFDSADHFFIGQSQGFPIRNLGTRFRLDDGTGAYAGPFYDIFQAVDQIDVGHSIKQQVKFYYFNSDTHLLERIRYETGQPGSETKVEVLFSGWHEVAGQQLPGVITRLENDHEVFTLTINSDSISAGLSDGTFSNPVAR